MTTKKSIEKETQRGYPIPIIEGSDVENFLIGGVSAKRVVNCIEVANVEEIYFVKDNYLYRIVIPYPCTDEFKTDYNKIKSTIDQILSTFKFIPR